MEKKCRPVNVIVRRACANIYGYTRNVRFVLFEYDGRTVVIHFRDDPIRVY